VINVFRLLRKMHADHEKIFQMQNLRFSQVPGDVFSDEEYVKDGVKLREDISGCDILIGIKEVPKQDLIPEKKYLFFSHTIKKQTAITRRF